MRNITGKDMEKGFATCLETAEPWRGLVDIVAERYNTVLSQKLTERPMEVSGLFRIWGRRNRPGWEIGGEVGQEWARQERRVRRR